MEDIKDCADIVKKIRNGVPREDLGFPVSAEFYNSVLTMVEAQESLEQDPCDTCGYEEGSIYCKEHCPHEAKIEQEHCGDAVSRADVRHLIAETNRNKLGCISTKAFKILYDGVDNLPPVYHQETVTEFADRCRECGREKVLDKIRAEIEDIAFDWQEIDGEHESFMVIDLNDALQIVDKYRAERTDT